MKYKFSCIAFAIASAISPALVYADINVSGSVSPSNPTTPSWVIPEGTQLIVGDGADGTLTASNGAYLTNLGYSNSIIGQNGGSGRVDIIGPGSMWENYSSSIHVGENFAHGILRIMDGGVVIAGGGGVEVAVTSSTGDIEVSGAGSQLIILYKLAVGTSYGSVGTMKIADGGAVFNGAAIGGSDGIGGYIGSGINSVGRVEVTGPGSIWDSHGLDSSFNRGLSVGWMGDGELTINNAGTVNVGNGIMIAAHADSTGVLNIGSAANDAATSAGYINTPRITMGIGDSSIVFNHTDSNYELNSVIDGDGKVEVVNGTTILNGNNIYSGTTTVYHGILKAGGGNTFSAASDYIINSVGQLDLAGFSQTLNSLSNGGTVSLNGAPGTVLTISGDYVGNDGLINFNSVLNDDNSATDMLVVNGNTSGTTRVSVTNLGGSGAETLNGIELIQVNGLSDGDFIKQGRIVAGAYDYSLTRGIGTNVSNWYLTSAAISADPLPMVERPEAGSYTANLAAANNMFVTSLNDRLGETQYIDALTGEHKATSLWLRNEGGHNRSRDTDGQLNTQANRYVMQLGGDIAQWSSNATDRFHLGVMAGYGNSKSTTVSQVTGYNSKGSTDGYSAGVYGTWYANEADKSGLYVDGWANYSWFNNTVNGQGLVTEEYKSKGVTASIESGYAFKVGENAAKNAVYFIQPKAQVTRMGVKADDHKEANGTYVSGKGDGNIQTRLGVKAFMNGYSDQDKGKDRVFQPFVETNWIHNTKDFGTAMDNVTVKQDGAANIAELKVGVEGQINRKVNLWGNVSQQVGNKGYSDTAVMLGVKYNF